MLMITSFIGECRTEITGHHMRVLRRGSGLINLAFYIRHECNHQMNMVSSKKTFGDVTSDRDGLPCLRFVLRLHQFYELDHWSIMYYIL